MFLTFGYSSKAIFIYDAPLRVSCKVSFSSLYWQDCHVNVIRMSSGPYDITLDQDGSTEMLQKGL